MIKKGVYDELVERGIIAQCTNAEKVKELSLPGVLVLEKSDHKLAETIISASGLQGVEILAMDSMQAVTPAEMKQGASYLNSMEKNLETLRKALN